jgi:hypothetical protein
MKGARSGGWSHNQGTGGSFLAYTLFRYDEIQDLYVGSAPWVLGESTVAGGLSGPGRYLRQRLCHTSLQPPVYMGGASGWLIYQGWRYPYVRSGQTLEPDYRSLSPENSSFCGGLTCVSSLLKKERLFVMS